MERYSLKPPPALLAIRPSPRAFCEDLPPIEHGPGDIVRKVDSEGVISFRNQPIRIGKAFRKQPVALRPVRTMASSTCTTASIASAETWICDPSPRPPVDLWTSQGRCPQNPSDINTKVKNGL